MPSVNSRLRVEVEVRFRVSVSVGDHVRVGVRLRMDFFLKAWPMFSCSILLTLRQVNKTRIKVYLTYL